MGSWATHPPTHTSNHVSVCISPLGALAILTTCRPPVFTQRDVYTRSSTCTSFRQANARYARALTNNTILVHPHTSRELTVLTIFDIDYRCATKSERRVTIVMNVRFSSVAARQHFQHYELRPRLQRPPRRRHLWNHEHNATIYDIRTLKHAMYIYTHLHTHPSKDNVARPIAPLIASQGQHSRHGLSASGAAPEKSNVVSKCCNFPNVALSQSR